MGPNRGKPKTGANNELTLQKPEPLQLEAVWGIIGTQVGGILSQDFTEGILTQDPTDVLFFSRGLPWQIVRGLTWGTRVVFPGKSQGP